jgi:MarR family transcriptional regulator, lower aerobic nicotinate degradation pathway regulator
MTLTSGDTAMPALLMTKPTWLVSQVSGHVQRLITERLAGTGARGYHVRVLAALAEFGPASQAGVGRRVDMDRSDMTTTVGELAAVGLIERTADTVDRRRNVVTITEAGRDRLAFLDTILNCAQEDLLVPLSELERTTLRELLTRLLDYHACATGHSAHAVAAQRTGGLGVARQCETTTRSG